MEYEIKKVHKSTRWLVNGQFHREGGPAIVYECGSKSWWKFDKLHRIDGPAFECPHGNHLYYINGKQYTKASFEKEAAKLAMSTVQG
ncbi:hypothetical protein UFOVP116_234 [uncultured Caudovirales phage]|uniref:Uncharacterized protein n=1 Tax=uncultured Caudovirales phage TaxID=2100421 RepID=A0A6J5LEG3_9CAUD|nr:hypothetical protein UFOVP116_234 [uncultured Caudovirales phage]